MSRGDDNLDNLFKDAYSAKEHAFDPAFWESTKQVYKAPALVPFYTRPYFITGVISVLIASVVWFSDTTPENNITANLPENQTEISITENQISTSPNELKTEKNLNTTTNKQRNSNIEVSTVAAIDNSPLAAANTSEESTIQAMLSEAISNAKTGNKSVDNNNPVATNANTFDEDEKTTSLNTPNINESNPSLVKSELNESSSKSANPTYQSTKNTAELVAETAVIGLNPGSENSSNKTPTEKGLATNKEQSMANQVNSQEANPNSFDSQKPEIETMSFSSLRKQELSLGFMKTKQNSYLKDNEGAYSLNPIEYEELKSLNRPFSILISTGYMWSQNLETAPNRISTSAHDKNIELSLEYHFKPHWGAQIGLSYNHTTESQTYNYLNPVHHSYWDYTTSEITVQDRTWFLGGWHYYEPYQDTITDTAWVTKIDTSSAQLLSEHQIRLIEIPVLLTYNIAVNRWNFQVASGASFGFFAGSSGMVLVDNDNVQEQSASKKLFNSVQYNYLLRTQVAYSISEHWQLSARPQMKMNLNSMYKSNSSHYQKYLFYGVNAGIIYRF